MKTNLKKIILFIAVTLIIQVVLFAIIFIGTLSVPPVGMWAIIYIVLLCYTIKNGWHELFWKVEVEKKHLTKEELDNMF